MHVFVVSDTHGSLERWRTFSSRLSFGARIIHLGDVLYHGPRNPLPPGYDPATLAEELKKYRVDYVRGNCDADVDYMVLEIEDIPRIMLKSYGKYHILCIHGDSPSLEEGIELARRENWHVLMYGHTHVPSITRKGQLLVFNPGSIALPKGGYPPTYGEIFLENDRLILRIVNLENGEKLFEERV